MYIHVFIRQRIVDDYIHVWEILIRTGVSQGKPMRRWMGAAKSHLYIYIYIYIYNLSSPEEGFVNELNRDKKNTMDN